MAWYSKRNGRDALDGSEDDCVFDSSSDDESILEDAVVLDELFTSDSESGDFYGFWGTIIKAIAHFATVANNFFVMYNSLLAGQH